MEVASFGLDEEYSSTISVPAFSHAVSLDFETKDSEGQFVTPEGVLKHKVLSSTSPEDVPVAMGQLRAAYGVVGMAGAGKTIALQGLAGDKDIRQRFPDGIQYMSLGQEATVEVAIQEIVRAMAATGATASIATVENSTTLREAVFHAIGWFQDKKCLLLIDDLWPTDGNPTGYLTYFHQLLQESPESRMAVSTRNLSIAVGAGALSTSSSRSPWACVYCNIHGTCEELF